MSTKKTIMVVGLGEIGKPLLDVIAPHHATIGVDITPQPRPLDPVDIMHVCYPFRIKDFVGETARYIERYSPQLTVIHSTVSVGTTRTVAERTGAHVVNSPVRGKHARMGEDLLRYDKFIGGLDETSLEKAARHFESVGMKTRKLSSPEATELAKLTETTYFGVMIAWAQEVERYCDEHDVSYDEVVSMYEEIPFFPPVKYFPGVIGGHCVMSNIEILTQMTSSPILDAIVESNARKMAREATHTAPEGATAYSGQ